ncbi:DNA-binding protein, partial [Kingella kingae]|uniref:DNA-binding protein n=1 Tax=Kingella kingae TaxID=504 RepID=UPI00254C590F
MNHANKRDCAFLSASDLADLKLSVLPETPKGIGDRAKKQGWVKRKRAERGGGYEYEIASMPSEIQAAIAAKLAEQALQNAP